MNKSIFLIRHGQSTHNVVWETTGKDPVILDAPLSPAGHRQVAGARPLAQSLGVDLVVTSPLTRALQTAIGLFGDSAPFLVTPMHREKLSNGCDVGSDPAKLAETFPGIEFSHLPACWWYDHPERDPRGFAVEPPDVFAGRVSEFRGWIMARPEQRIAIIGHGMFFKHLAGTMFDNCVIMVWRPGDDAEVVPYAP